MQDTMLKVYKALNGSAEISERFKGVYNNPTAPDDTVFPRLTMFEVSNKDADFADDAPLASLVYIRIDVWSRTNDLFKLSCAVKRIIKETFLLCDVSFGQDIYEQDSLIYHKPIDVTVKIRQ